MATIRYTDSLAGITSDMLGGFFEGWRAPPSPEKHLRILQGSRHVVLAIDESSGRVVGFINALADGCNSAFIPLLEVVAAYRGQGIGKELVTRMLQRLRDYPCIDLTCDPGLQPFYEKWGLLKSTGMVVREYGRTGPA
jgi:GNAT superfamily N-acetyltransferase